MFKIESYITSIILANADKYIKNFRKQDAQVSLWEGDATFHNIDLNVDALNEEFQSSFIFTSGYIHDLIIHVPWTKLMSEPVTISVNTIECVMRLKSKDERIICGHEKPSSTNTESKDSNDKRTSDETSNQSSYTSALTSKIMNNLSIRCENVILKLVEEDIVFSMNIEKLTFDNVSENWIQTMTDVNLEKLLTRKLIALSGVTICLDKQNSSGRIDTYLEPLLYRCQIHIRLLRAYNRAISKKPVYTRFDILSDKMSFTISEPQVPMLFKLAILILYSNDTTSSINSRNLSFNSDSISTKSDGSVLCNENVTESDTSWGNWLWSIVPSILSQDDDISTPNYDVDVTCTFHIGFCVKILETNLKVLSRRVKKSSKIEFDDILKSTFNGCVYRMVMRNSEWFNVQFGVNYVSVETSSQDCNHLLQQNQFVKAGAESEYDFLKDTLFDETSLYSNRRRRDDDLEEEHNDTTNFDFLYKTNFTLQSHLNLYTEHVLLEKTQAFAVDYLKCYQPRKEYENEEVSRYSDDESVEELTPELKSNRLEKHVLLRFVFGSSEIKITSGVIDSINYVHKIIPYNEYVNLNQLSGGVVESERYNQNKYTPNYITQFTLFDLALEFQPTLSRDQIPSNSSTNPAIAEGPQTIPPAIFISCKCIDGKINTVRNATTDNRVELKKITTFKAVEVGCFVTKLDQKSPLFKCEKFDCDFAHNLCEFQRELRVETRNLRLTSSKSHLLLAGYIFNYIWSSFKRSEFKTEYYRKIFHSSLLDDSYVPSNVILELFVENLTIGYKSIKNAFNVNVSMNNCKAYAIQLKDHVQKRILVFTTTESTSESSRIHVMIQRCENCDEGCDSPSCIWFNFNNLKINLDVTLYSWIMYDPVPVLANHTLPKTNTSTQEQIVCKSVASRKISESNSGTHSRRYSTNFPKPKESVHSSSEHEALSPPVVTDTETSDVFQLPPETKPPKRNSSWTAYLKNNIRQWRSLVVYGEISQITVYVPTNEFIPRNESHTMEHLIKESFESRIGHNSKLNVFAVSLKSAKVKCDLPINILEELSNEALVSFSKIGWSADKLTFPWTVSISDLSIDTLLQNNVCKPLLKPLSANCTVGISLKSNTENQSTVAVCVHSDFQPIVISLSHDQVNSITETIAVLNDFHKNRRKIQASSELSDHLVTTQSRDENGTFDEIQNKCTGWIQWTFTKCCINLYSKCDSELRKLSTEFEDSIMSLEFDETFHKMKLKIASFGIHHYKRKSKNDLWQNGIFHGVIIQRCYSQPSSVDKKNDEEGDDRFLLATVTRAKSSNLRTRLQQSQTSSELLSYTRDSFVTEIILRICPTDVIVPLNVIESFLSLLIPIKKSLFADYHSTRANEKEKERAPSARLPLMYLDAPKIRIFIPLSNAVENEWYDVNDTIVCEIGSVHLDCHPENPIVRKPLRHNLYYALSGKSYANVEQKLQNQQYELMVSDISVNLGVWYEIQKMLEKEHLSVEEPPSAFEQNPAVMWNQGGHPESKHKINLRRLSPIVSKFSCKTLLAPPVESFALKAITFSACYEIALQSDINVTISLNQIALLTLLYKEFADRILPYFEIDDNTRLNRNPSSESGGAKSKLTDSGIESMDQSSVDSSSVFRNKSECPSGHVQSVNSKIFYSALSSNASGTNQRAGFLTKCENTRQIYVTAQNINVIFYKTCEIQENGNKQIVYDPLMCAEIVQPCIFLNNENDSSMTQLSIFNVSVKLPTMRADNSYFACIPSTKDFPRALLYAMKSKCDSYSRIKYPCLTIKSIVDTNKRRKNEVTLGQPVLVDCDLNAIRYILSSVQTCTSEYKHSIQVFQPTFDKRDQSVQTCEKDVEFDDRKRYMSLICSTSFHTDRIVLLFKRENKARNLLLNVDAIDVKTKAARELKTLPESVSLECVFESICISLPEIPSTNLNDVFTDDIMTQRKVDILSNMVLKPWNVEVEILMVFQKWNLSRPSPWTCVKIRSQNLICEINPQYLELVCSLLFEYRKVYDTYFTGAQKPPTKRPQNTSEDVVGENYKDDLRAGAFQYIKNEIDRYELPSPYEVVFCNRRVQPYMSWRYPQPRCLTKLQIYPVPVEDVNDDYLEEEIRCQLQYYDEIRATFMPFVSFGLSENTIQTVNLPKPNTVAAECWRIILYDATDSRENVNNLKIDVRSLAGCVRVDSIFQPCLVPTQQILISVTEIQVNFFTLLGAENVAVENYAVGYVPTKQHFLSAVCNDFKVYVSSYNHHENKTIEFCGVYRADILNYEYLMLQSFVEPVCAECAFHFSQDAAPKMSALIKKVGIRVSPNFIHTLSVSKDLWNGWKCNSPSPWRITAPFVVCNNTNYFITFGQEGSSEEIALEPFSCRLYAWHNPVLPKSVRVKVDTFDFAYETTVMREIYHETFHREIFSSAPIEIKKSGSNDSLCENETKTETSRLFVSVVQHSSVVNQVIVYGNLLMYNLTDSEMEMCVLSHGKRDAKFSSTRTIGRTAIKRNRLLSIIVPDGHKLSFKVRYGSSLTYWSGLIPLVVFQQSSDQNSWMVKVPLKNHKEHFQSIWCQVTRETVNGCPKYLVVFRPLCSVISFLPWQSQIRIKNDVGSVLSCCTINDKGSSSELFTPNTVTLDKYTVEWKPAADSDTYVVNVQIETLPRRKIQREEYSIRSLVEEISADMDDRKWPFLNIDTSRFSWKTDKIYEIKPTIHVHRNEEKGCGTKIEIYPWAIIVNMLSYRVLLDISDTVYTIESYEIVAPPRIESTFKLGIADGKDYLSGILQLSDDQSFRIPKVTGRIPMNGFVTTMIECDVYVTFVNIASKNHKDMRIISMCSSYVISNNSETDIECAALVVCRTGNRSSMVCDIPNNLETMSVHLPAKQNSTTAQPIAKWYKIGKGDVQVLPYLILSVNGNVACPVRICDLSEKQRYSVVFSGRSAQETPIRVFMTAQQNEGQVFLTIWDETVPQITIHNMSELALNVASSKSDRASTEVSHCSDWNWKFAVAAAGTAYFHIPQLIVENQKKTLQYLKFSVENTKPVKETKWSCGVPVKPCVNQLITLPLSQRHIKLAIFRDGFTYVVWIESATSDELSAKMIRTRLSESFLPIDGPGASSVTEISANHTEDSNEIPQKIANLYNMGRLKLYDVNVLVERICVTLSCDDDVTFEENDVATVSFESITINLSAIRKANEVKEDIRCCLDVARYRIDNDQFHRHAFDFPVVLLSDSPPTDEPVKTNYSLRDLAAASGGDDSTAMKITVIFDGDGSSNLSIRDLDVALRSQDVFLEDKFMSRLKSVLENVFSATFDSSILRNGRLENTDEGQLADVNVKPIEKRANVFAKDAKSNEIPSTVKPKSSSSKSVNVSENYTDDESHSNSVVFSGGVWPSDDNAQYVVTADCVLDEKECGGGGGGCGESVTARSQRNETGNYAPVPANVIALSRRIAKPLRLRSFRISSFYATVSLHTSTTFYIALDRSPLSFSEFKKQYLITTPFELGSLLTLHYFFGAVYGTGWAITSLEFVGSPGVLARTLGTGIKDFVSMPIYGIASGPRGFVLGVAHGSASLMKHVMAGTLSSVTKFAGSWARTLDRFTLDADDLLQSEEIRRFPPTNITEGVLQGLSEFGISVLGGISGLAHHPLQYAVSSSGNRSLINSISLGIVGVLTRPLSGAAELVARTGQGILSHVGWNTVPTIRNEPAVDRNFSHLQICCLKYHWKRENDYVLIAVEATNAENVTIPLWITLTSKYLHVAEITENGHRTAYDIRVHEFQDCDADPTIITILRPKLNLKNPEDFCKARIVKFITETNHYCNIENTYAKENSSYCNEMEIMFSFYVNPRIKNFLLTMISFIKNVPES